MGRFTQVRHVVLRVAVMLPLSAFLVGGVAMPAAHAAGGPVALTITPDQPSYTPGQPVTLTLQLTNNGSTPCQASDLVDGNVVLDSYLRNGSPVPEPSSLIRYDDSLSSLILHSLHTINPGSSLSLVWTTTTNELTGGQAFMEVPFPGDVIGPVDFLDAATPGNYVLQAHYQLPPPITLLPPDSCSVSSNVATASFTVIPGAVPAAGVDGIVIDPLANAAFNKDYKDCLAKFQAAGGDPMGIIPVLTASTFTTTVSASVGGNSEVATTPNDGKSPRDGGTGKGSNTQVNWNNKNTNKFDDGVARDPCAELYHELFHAYEDIKGISDDRNFPGTMIPTVEVNATRAENAYRKAQGLPLRTSYTTTTGELKLPVAAGTKVPTCVLTSIVAGPPKKITVTVRDSDPDGLDNIVVAAVKNATVTVPAVTRGTRTAIVVTATKTNQAQPSSVTLYVTDVDGNLVRCDPVEATVTRQAGVPETSRLSDIPATEHLLHVANGPGSTGLRDLVVRVDGHRIDVILNPGQTRVVDIGRAFTAATGNTVLLTPLGRPGASADVVIADS
ncbi:MAG: type III secretion system effector protein [Actinomycetota bacterium]|nr:type III secretion system effector protein [Actinomycetota bacterium]